MTKDKVTSLNIYWSKYFDELFDKIKEFQNSGNQEISLEILGYPKSGKSVCTFLTMLKLAELDSKRSYL